MPNPPRPHPLFRAIAPAVALTLVLAGLPGHAAAQSRSLNIVGELSGGQTRAVAVGPTHAYAGRGHWLVAYDVRGSGLPAEVGRTSLLAGTPADIELAGDLAFVATDESASLTVVDIGDPTAPRVLASVLLAGRAAAVELAGGYAYVAGIAPDVPHDGVVWVLDVHDPRSPELVGSFRAPGDAGWYPWTVGLALVGQRALFAYLDVLVLDISDPRQPRQVATYHNLGETTGGIAVDGTHVFVPTYSFENELRVYDASDPDHPTLVASAALIRMPNNITLRGNRAYVSLSALDNLDCAVTGDDIGRVQVFDVTDPAAPRDLGAVELPYEVYAAGLYDPAVVLVATGAAGLYVADMTDPAGARPVDASGDRLGYVSAITHLGDRVFVLDERESGLNTRANIRLSAFDVSAPEHPRHLGAIPINVGWNHVLTAADGVLYLGYSLPPTFALLDARDPARIRPLATLDLGNGAPPDAVAVSGGYAFVASWSRLDVYDVHLPQVPRQVASLRARGGNFEDMAIDGGYAYLLRSASIRFDEGRHVLVVVDLRDPLHPREVSTLGLIGDENYLYSITAGAGFVVLGGALLVDVRDPTRPRLGSRLDPRLPLSIYRRRLGLIDGGRLFTDADGCLRVFDLTTAASASLAGPPLIATLDRPGVTPRLIDLDTSGDMLTIASAAGGLLLARLGDGPVAAPAACTSAAWLPARKLAHLPFALTRSK